MNHTLTMIISKVSIPLKMLLLVFGYWVCNGRKLLFICMVGTGIFVWHAKNEQGLDTLPNTCLGYVFGIHTWLYGVWPLWLASQEPVRDENLLSW